MQIATTCFFVLGLRHTDVFEGQRKLQSSLTEAIGENELELFSVSRALFMIHKRCVVF